MILNAQPQTLSGPLSRPYDGREYSHWISVLLSQNVVLRLRAQTPSPPQRSLIGLRPKTQDPITLCHERVVSLI